MRAIAFLFMTKMLLALLLELPYDILVHGKVAALPLAINIVFHPVFLAVIGMSVSVPTKKNTDKIEQALRSIVIGEGEFIAVFKARGSRSAFAAVFNALYAAMFIVSYGAVAWLLSTLGFNVFSISLFLLFLSLVAFFGVKIRLSKRELLLSDKGAGFFGLLFDFFFLPIIRVGRWISLRAPKINVFIFFLDFIIEAPFKLAIEVIEGWLAFMREKKEEIT